MGMDVHTLPSLALLDTDWPSFLGRVKVINVSRLCCTLVYIQYAHRILETGNMCVSLLSVHQLDINPPPSWT